MRAPIRSGYGASVLRTLAIVVPAMLFVVIAGIAVFALSGNLGAGILTLVLLFPPLYIGAVWGARRLDYTLDRSNPVVRLEEDVLVLPIDGEERRLPRADLKAAAGYYNQRARSTYRVTEVPGRGVFLHLRGQDLDLVLRAHDDLCDAPARGIKRYQGPPEGIPEVRVWARDLVPLIGELTRKG